MCLFTIVTNVQLFYGRKESNHIAKEMFSTRVVLQYIVLQLYKPTSLKYIPFKFASVQYIL